jgi:phosphatidylglycerol:prolipoprotein diacylglycerol transferase
MHPILYHSARFNFSIRSYGVMLFIAFIAGIWHAVDSARRRPQEGISAEQTMDVSIWMIISGILFARLAFVVLDPNPAQYNWRNVLAVWNGGISFDGALFGALLAMGIFCATRKIPFLMMADRCAAPAMIGYAIGRVGCLLNGCCYGAPTSLPWGIKFQEQAGPFTYWTPPSHPTQLYATLISLVWYALLTWRERHGRAYVGELTCWYMMLSAIERFTIEFWRAGTTSDMVHGTPFTTAQFFCFFLFALGAGGMIYLRRKVSDANPGGGSAHEEAAAAASPASALDVRT